VPNVPVSEMFWMHPMQLVVTCFTWNLILVYLDMVFVLVPDRCMVCAEHTIGSEIILDAPDNS
jgi:hypothetical protein